MSQTGKRRNVETSKRRIADGLRQPVAPGEMVDAPSSIRAAASSQLSGILIIDKPAGITSMTAVAMVRRKAGGARTGHAGTLDPLATGVLVMAIGSATKCIDQLMATTKRYQTVIDLSAFTTTDDAEGQRTDVRVDEIPSEAAVREALGRFIGRIEQRPPAFSAVKIDGKRAYKLARKGQAVETKPRSVVIHSIELTRYNWPLVELEMHCDKGVYVRSLARDLGTALGTGGFCAMIRRTAVGPFTLDLARTIESLPHTLSSADVLSMSQAMTMLKTQASPA